MILDTCVLIDLMRKDPAAIQAVKELEEAETFLQLSTVSVMELYSGAVRSKQRMIEESKIESALSSLQMLALTKKIARRAGIIEGELAARGALIEVEDCIISATALECEEKLLTRNSKHFERVPGLSLETY